MVKINKVMLYTTMLILTGCAAKSPQKMYNWNGYQDSVYHFYTNKTSPQEQIATLQKLVELSKANNKPVPPGVHAQLGMLYGNTGNADLAMGEFNAEKSQYPESASYINFLTNRK
ncbi:DUF4810 domain-containing protein [Tatumella citrea]|uniref:DUF4810 domain-containing protein n=1 Tax=Tatumella citrea TaxID=53336 RepID=A0A1Y0LGT1_TATCI|nr:DUF4810 domain-containing protein [Tatumella citrea]ARU92691.1 hypothetical protein A7K98_02105 [Tatumella citrea]ARU96728.1 hypothetical protein A7K99_02105 [Tatumella citrea]